MGGQGRTPHDSNGPKTGAAWKETSWRSIWQDSARGVVAATPTNRQWQGDRNAWLTKRAPENRMQCPKGGEVWRRLDVAVDERGIIVFVLPLWSFGYLPGKKWTTTS